MSRLSCLAKLKVGDQVEVGFRTNCHFPIDWYLIPDQMRIYTVQTHGSTGMSTREDGRYIPLDAIKRIIKP